MATKETDTKLETETSDTEPVPKSKMDVSEPNDKTPSDESVNVTSSLSPEKHPLQNKWVLYFFKPDKSKQWNDCIRKIIDFDSVEGFWAVYNHIKPPSQVTNGCDYMIFKDGIKPMWEDKGNKNGGRWLLTLDRREKREGTLDNVWMETLMCLVGEVFEESSDDICGAVVQNRNKGDKVSIWTADCKNRDGLSTIGRMYKDKLHICLNGRFSIQYQSHQDTSTKSGSMSKSILTL